MQLNELFSRTAPFQFRSDAANTTADFNMGGETYRVYFIKPIRETIVKVSFSLLDKQDPEREHFGITNSGNAIQVFGTVLAVITNYIQRIDPDQIFFTSDVSEPSRVKLYDRMVANMAKGWELQTKVKSWGTKEYLLINPKFREPEQPTGKFDDVPY